MLPKLVSLWTVVWSFYIYLCFMFLTVTNTRGWLKIKTKPKARERQSSRNFLIILMIIKVFQASSSSLWCFPHTYTHNSESGLDFLIEWYQRFWPTARIFSGTMYSLNKSIMKLNKCLFNTWYFESVRNSLSLNISKRMTGQWSSRKFVHLYLSGINVMLLVRKPSW